MKILLSLLFPLIFTSCVTDTTAMIQAELQQRVLMEDRHDFDTMLVTNSDLPMDQKIEITEELDDNHSQFLENSDRQIRWLNAMGEFDWDRIEEFFIDELPVEAIREILSPPEVDGQ